MASEKVIIVNKKGLHARASAKFVGAVANLAPGTTVFVCKDDTRANGASIMGLMMLGAACGDEIEIHVDGDEAHPTLAKLVGIVKDGFGED